MIFNVSNAGGSGKLVHLNISYDSSLAGATITATNGSEVHTATANASGLTVISGKNLGVWTVSENEQETSVEINTTFYGNYNASIGGDIFINVTYDSDFTGKTITCTNGVKTLTRVASGGSIQFCVNDTGTWTISGVVGGTTYSTSVTVAHGNTYNVNLQTTLTLNLTVYSGASDTVYYYPDNDTSKSAITLCTTDTTGKAENVSLTVMPNTSITFYSTIAKNTTNGSSAYSKSIVFTNDITELKIMPNNSLYWWGNECSWLTGGVNIEHERDDYATISKNTNSLYGKMDGSSTYWGMYKIVSINSLSYSGISKIKLFGTFYMQTTQGTNASSYLSANTPQGTNNSVICGVYKTISTYNSTNTWESTDIVSSQSDGTLNITLSISNSGSKYETTINAIILE